MKEIAAQFLVIWKGIKPLQKGMVFAILLFVTIGLFYLTLNSTGSSFVSLPVSPSEISSVRAYLESSGIPYKEKPKKGILVPEDQFERVRLDLRATSSESLKSEPRKGFELFDTNTWIKGEKELQVLEMRALKGQLEKDLSAFEHIKSASVILDLSPARSFGGAQYKTKASVILTLMPKAHLSVSQLRAITYHLAGAVRGLEPKMIAISDTTGKLYKKIDPDGEEDYLSSAALAFEQHLEHKIHAFLSAFSGEDRFFSSVQASIEQGSELPSSFSITVAVDKEYERVLEEIQKQLEGIVSGYQIPFQIIIDAIPFEKKRGLWIEKKKPGGYGGLVLTVSVLSLALFSLYPLFRRFSKKKEEDKFFQMMTQVDLSKLAHLIKEEDPGTIALMLSYLEPERAEQLMASFPERLQEEVLAHLNEL